MGRSHSKSKSFENKRIALYKLEKMIIEAIALALHEDLR